MATCKICNEDKSDGVIPPCQDSSSPGYFVCSGCYEKEGLGAFLEGEDEKEYLKCRACRDEVKDAAVWKGILKDSDVEALASYVEDVFELKNPPQEPEYARKGRVEGDDWNIGFAIFAALTSGPTTLYKALKRSKDEAVRQVLALPGAMDALREVLSKEDETDTDADAAKSTAAGMKAILDKINTANEKTGDVQDAEVLKRLKEFTDELDRYLEQKDEALTAILVFDPIHEGVVTLGDFVGGRLNDSGGGCNNIFYDSVIETVSAIAQHGPSIEVAIRARLKEAGVTV